MAVDLGIVEIKIKSDPIDNGKFVAEIHSIENEPENLFDSGINFPTFFSAMDKRLAVRGLSMRLKQKGYAGTLRVVKG